MKRQKKLLTNLATQLEEINQKTLAKDWGRAKRYQDMVKKTGHSKIMKENTTNKSIESVHWSKI